MKYCVIRMCKWKTETRGKESICPELVLGARGLVFIVAGAVCNIWEFAPVQTYGTTCRLVSIFYGNLRPVGAQTICLLHFMLQIYTTQQKTSILNNNHPTKNNTMVEPVASLAGRR
jgi:hypothetical protein